MINCLNILLDANASPAAWNTLIAVRQFTCGKCKLLSLFRIRICVCWSTCVCVSVCLTYKEPVHGNAAAAERKRLGWCRSRLRCSDYNESLTQTERAAQMPAGQIAVSYKTTLSTANCTTNLVECGCSGCKCCLDYVEVLRLGYWFKHLTQTTVFP